MLLDNLTAKPSLCVPIGVSSSFWRFWLSFHWDSFFPLLALRQSLSWPRCCTLRRAVCVTPLQGLDDNFLQSLCQLLWFLASFKLWSTSISRQFILSSDLDNMSGTDSAPSGATSGKSGSRSSKRGKGRAASGAPSSSLKRWVVVEDVFS